MSEMRECAEKLWCICCGYRGWVLDVDANNQPRRVSCWRCGASASATEGPRVDAEARR